MPTPEEIARLLPKQQREVYLAVANHSGDITGAELDKLLGDQNIHKALSDLEQKGVVKKNGKRTCAETKRYVSAWVATGTLPGRQQSKNTAVPTPGQIQAFVEEVRKMAAIATADGFRYSSTFKQVFHWLACGANPREDDDGSSC